MTGIDAGVWPDVAQKIGLGGAMLLVLAIGAAVGLATRGPEWIKAGASVLDTILTHRRESRRVKAEVAREQENLKLAFERRGIDKAAEMEGSK